MAKAKKTEAQFDPNDPRFMPTFLVIPFDDGTVAAHGVYVMTYQDVGKFLSTFLINEELTNKFMGHFQNAKIGNSLEGLYESYKFGDFDEESLDTALLKALNTFPGRHKIYVYYKEPGWHEAKIRPAENGSFTIEMQDLQAACRDGIEAYDRGPVEKIEEPRRPTF